MKEQRPGTLLQSQPNGSTTDKKNLNSEIIVKEKYEDFNIIENTLTGIALFISCAALISSSILAILACKAALSPAVIDHF